MNPHDDEHDAWLREALRHAPDAHIGAPLALSDTILRQARAATVAPAPAAVQPGGLRGFAEFWSWLTRPAIATGFASVMAATLVGILWWGRPMDEAAMPAPPTAAMVAAPPAVEIAAAPPPQVVKPAVVASLPPAATNANAAVSKESARERRGEVPANRAKAAAPARRDDERMAVVTATDAAVRDASPQQPPPSPPPEQGAPARGEAMAMLKREAAPASPATVAAAEVAAQPMAAARAEADTAAPAAKAAPRAAGAAARVAIAQAPAALAARPVESPLRELRAAIRAEPERWRWQRGEGNAQAMTAALQAWLAQVDETSTAPTATGNAGAAPTLRLLRDGSSHSTLILGADSLHLAPADAARPAVQWALSPAAAAALRDALDAATR